MTTITTLRGMGSAERAHQQSGSPCKRRGSDHHTSLPALATSELTADSMKTCKSMMIHDDHDRYTTRPLARALLYACAGYSLPRYAARDYAALRSMMILDDA